MKDRKHNHYFKDVSNLSHVDVYRVLALFNVTDPCIQHAVKKLLVAGGRGAGKDIHKDIAEAIDTLQRWQEMREEAGVEVSFKPPDAIPATLSEQSNEQSIIYGPIKGPFSNCATDPEKINLRARDDLVKATKYAILVYLRVHKHHEALSGLQLAGLL